MPTRELGRADVVFDVKVDGSKLGELRVSKGTVVWYPAGNIYGYRLDWTDFGQLMQEYGGRDERR
jgi:hypothetical protein